jgi:hypothetical protein
VQNTHVESKKYMGICSYGRGSAELKTKLLTAQLSAELLEFYGMLIFKLSHVWSSRDACLGIWKFVNTGLNKGRENAGRIYSPVMINAILFWNFPENG